MKKFINRVDDVLVEALDGFAAAHADLVRVHRDPTFVTRAAPTRAGKVALLSGGGSGHEPMHAGLVGVGMLDAACPGQVFTSPTPDQMLAAAQAVESGAGVLFIVKNYEGDVMNFEMAAEMLPSEQATVLVNDDVAVEDSTYTTGRRGVAGTTIVEKIVGAAAEAGAGLAGWQALGERVNQATGSMGVALTSCTVPAAGTPTFTLGADEMESRGTPVLLHVNGFGGSDEALRRARPRDRALAGRQLHDLARHGRLLADADQARRRADQPLGRPRAHPCAALGALRAQPASSQRWAGSVLKRQTRSGPAITLR